MNNIFSYLNQISINRNSKNTNNKTAAMITSENRTLAYFTYIANYNNEKER